MTDQPTSQSADDAAAHLGAAARGEKAGSQLSRSAIGPIRYYSFALAALIAVYFLALVYVLSDADSSVVWIVTGVYLVVLAVVVVGYLRARRATAPRANRRLVIGIFATMVLFIGGTLLSTVVETRTPLLWLPYTAVMVLPLVLSTFVRASR